MLDLAGAARLSSQHVEHDDGNGKLPAGPGDRVAPLSEVVEIRRYAVPPFRSGPFFFCTMQFRVTRAQRCRASRP